MADIAITGVFMPDKSGYISWGDSGEGMTGKADTPHEADKPKESHPAPDAAQKPGIGADPFMQAEWRATQQERIRAQDHSATDLLHDKEKPQPHKTKFELVDDAAAKRAERLARAKEQENTGSLIAKEAKKNPAAEPVNKLKQWADKLPDGPDKEHFEKLVRQQAASLSPELAARMKERGATHEGVPAGHPPDWMEAGRKLAALPFEKQAQIIGSGLMAGLEQYSHEQRERQLGALIGTVQGVGDTAVNLAKVADFCAYCIIGDKARAGKMGAEFGTSVGQSIISGVNIFEAAKEYGENIQKSGDIGKPIRDVIAVGQILDREWSKLPPREQERQKYELIGQLVSDSFIGPPGAKAIGKATKFTEVLGCISKAAAEHGGHTVDEIRKAVGKISDVVKDLMAPEFVMEGGVKIKASQLEKGEQNLLKSIGRAGEYTPETKPLFATLDGKRLYSDKEIEAMGGVKALEQMTPEQLKSKDLKRYEMPKIHVHSFGDTFSANIPGTLSILNATQAEKGVVDIVNIRKGLLPDGAGAHFLAAVLKANESIPTKELICSLIKNKETMEAFANHLPAEQSFMGRHMIKALKELGLRVDSAAWFDDHGSVNIVFKIKR